MKLSTLRAILRRNHEWERLRPDVSMLPDPEEEHGKALTRSEEETLLAECKASISRVLYPAVVLSLYTAMRRDEVRLLQWKQVNLKEAYLTVGKSKTRYGKGREMPLIGPALQTLTEWAEQFPTRLPEHYVFPAERYAFNAQKTTMYGFDPTRPTPGWKQAWSSARKRAGINLRFHDLRHTALTRMIVDESTLVRVAKIMGWSLDHVCYGNKILAPQLGRKEGDDGTHVGARLVQAYQKTGRQ